MLREHKTEALGDPLQVIALNIDFDHLTQGELRERAAEEAQQ